jgi:multidrug efflux pump subunit AcrA (membrane-fusion protein)
VNELQGSYQVAVVDSNNTVQIRNVALGPQLGSDLIITSGIKPHERVVTEGVSKLKDGMRVSPKLTTAAATVTQQKPEGQ